MSNENIVKELKKIELDGDLEQILGSDLMKRLYAALTQQPESEAQSHADPDGCPTEMAVLKRFWREHRQPESEPVGYINKHYLDTDEDRSAQYNCGTISQVPRDAGGVLYDIPVFLNAQPAQQMPEATEENQND